MLPGHNTTETDMSVSEQNRSQKQQDTVSDSSQEANAKAQRQASSAAKIVGRLNAAANPALIALHSAMLI